MKYVLERLSERHRKPVIDILNFFIKNGFAAYPDSEVDYVFFDRLMEMARGYPAVAAKEAADRIVGFGFLRPFHFAATFKRTAEVSYFLLPETTRQGLGTTILESYSRAQSRWVSIRSWPAFRRGMPKASTFTSSVVSWNAVGSRRLGENSGRISMSFGCKDVFENRRRSWVPAA